MVVNPDSSGSLCSRAVRMPSVTTSSRVPASKRRSKRICQPTSRPSVQPRSAAIRAAIARAATRRGWSRITGPSASSAGGTRVVLPAPGAAVITAARDRRTRSTISSSRGSIGSGITSGADAGADRAAHTGAPEAAVAVGILGQVLLVVVLRVVELRRLDNLGGDRSVAGRGQLFLERVARRFGGAALIVVLVIDARAILRADV